MSTMLARNLSPRLITISRTFASQAKLVETTRNEKTGITTISMSRAPTNALNLEMTVSIRKALEDAHDNGCKGIILTSSLPTVYSAGLDIMEMYHPDMKRAKEFWTNFQELWLTLFSLELPTVAAINGACPAGGCLLAMSCEYRVLVDGPKNTIGLNETQLGLVAPKWMQSMLQRTIGLRKAELALLRGTLFPPKEALDIGLVDELATDKDDCNTKCENYISSFQKIPAEARTAAKMSVRQEHINWMEKNRDWDTGVFLHHIQLPSVQASLETYIKMLKAKQKLQ